MSDPLHGARRSRPRRRRATYAVGALLLLVVAGCAAPSSVTGGQRHGPDTSATSPSAGAGPRAGGARPGSVSVVAVGDLVCESNEEPTPTTCQQQATADLAARLDPQAVIALGDLQYQSGARSEFERVWRPTWGRFDDIIAPVPGNHEYGTSGAAGYRSYFGTGPYYSRDFGAWRVYLLDSNCGETDCAEEAAWLSSRLREDPRRCTAIAMHHPRVSSGKHGSSDDVDPLWRAAVEGGVDLALSGHDHDYERFSRLDADGTPSPGPGGTREFVVGTGGKSLYELGDREPGSEVARDDRFGVLDLSLDPAGFGWRFVSVDGSVLDRGSDACTP